MRSGRCSCSRRALTRHAGLLRHVVRMPIYHILHGRGTCALRNSWCINCCVVSGLLVDTVLQRRLHPCLICRHIATTTLHLCCHYMVLIPNTCCRLVLSSPSGQVAVSNLHLAAQGGARLIRRGGQPASDLPGV
jgi:hypothetical protein